MRKKEKIMTAVAMAAEGLELAGELLGTIRRRTAMAQQERRENCEQPARQHSRRCRATGGYGQRKTEPEIVGRCQSLAVRRGRGSGSWSGSVVRADAGCEDASHLVQKGDPLRRGERGDGDE